MSASDPAPQRTLSALRLSILLTGLAMILALALLVKETAYVFAGFMILGPALLGLAVVLLGRVIWSELRAKQVL